MTSKKLQTMMVLLMITALCIMSISIVMYNMTADLMKQEVENAYQVSLQNTRSQMETYFRAIDQLTLQFEKMPEVVELTQGNIDPLILGTVLNQALRLHASLDDVDNVLIYHGDHNITISTNDEKSNRYTQYTPIFDTFSEMNTDKAFIMTELEGIPITAFIRKLPVFSQAQTVYIMFQLNRNVFDRILGRSTYHESGSYFIFDEQGGVVANRGYFQNEEVNMWAEQIHKEREGIVGEQSSVLSLQDVFITYLAPSYNGWSYGFAVTNRSFLHKAEELRNVILLISILIFMIAAALSLASTHWLWRGWHRMKSLLDNNELTPAALQTRNEFEDYLAKVQNIVSHSEHLKKQTAEMLPQLKEAISLSLLENGAVSSEVMEKAKQYGIHVREGAYCCLCIVIDYPEGEEDLYSSWDMTTLEYAVVSVIKEVIEKNAYGFSVNSQKGHAVAMLSCGLEESEQLAETVSNVTKTIREFIEQYFPVTVSIGVSKIRTDMNLLKLSYNEALNALNQRIISTGNQIFYASDAVESYTDEPFAFQELEKDMIHAIMTRNQALSYEVVEKLFVLKDMKNIHYKWFQNKMIEITQLLSRQLQQKLKDRDVREPTLDELLSLSSLEEWVNCLKQHYIDKPIAYLEQQHQSNSISVTNRLKEYVAAHVGSDLQLNEVCKSLNIPVSYAKQALKETMDITFTELLLDARIEQSKRWLASEEYGVEEIAKLLCYSNAQNFSRTFKKAVGIPPGQYRIKAREGTLPINE